MNLWDATHLKLAITAITYVWFIVLFASLASAVFANLIGFLFPRIRIVSVIFVAANDRLELILLRKWGLVLAVIPLGAWIAKFAGMDIDLFPPAGSRERPWLDVIAVYLFWVWLDLGTLKMAGTKTLLKGLELDARAKNIIKLSGLNGFLTGSILFLVTFSAETPYAVVGIITAYGLTLWNKWSLLNVAASLRRDLAPKAEDQCCKADVEQPFLVQVSDLHATGDRKSRADGKLSGDAICMEITDRLAGRALPKFCLVTGDLVDRGEQSEWDYVLPHFITLRDRGCRVLLAPGNHDLATAYMPSLAFEFLSPAAPGRAVSDANRLIQYLRAAAALEPELRTYAGESISSVIEREVAPVEKLQEDWKAAVAEACQIVRADSRFSASLRASAENHGAEILSILATVDKIAAARLVDPLIDRTLNVFATPDFYPGESGRRAARTVLTTGRECKFQRVDVAIKWRSLWTGLFPLRFRAEEQRIEFLIVNSVDPNPSFLGSAFGHLSDEQIERLSAAANECAGRTVVILMHHSICRWTDSADDIPNATRDEIEQWGLLVHNTVESKKLVELYSKLIENGVRQVVVCSGHRHGQSRAGPILDDQNRPIALGRVWVVESAACCDLDPANSVEHDLLFASLGADGILRPFRARLPQSPWHN